MRELHVIGAGGHAKVVIATARAAGFAIVAAYDDANQSHGSSVLGVPIVGPPVLLSGKNAPAVLAIGDNRTRAQLTSKLDCAWQTIIHPRATVDASATIGEGSVVFAGAVVQPEASLGRHVIINTCASVDHDCDLADFVHVSPGAHLAGSTTLRVGVFFATGASSIPGVCVGDWTVVGAGATVVRDLPADCVAYGVPARRKG